MDEVHAVNEQLPSVSASVEPGPAEQALVRAEILRLWALRTYLASRTSWLGYGALFILLRNVVDTWLLGAWLALFVTTELLHILLERQLLRSLDDPVARQKYVRILTVTLFPMGMLWGAVPLMPGVSDSPVTYMLCLLFLSVVALLSVHNLCFIRRTLTIFTAGIALPIVFLGVTGVEEFHSVVALSALLYLLMLQFYGQTTHKLMIHDIVGSVMTRKLAADLQTSNKELREALHQVNELARVDPLTKCLNRRSMTEFLEQEMKRTARHGVGFGVIMVDLDHFKSINDKYGHATGDAVLVQTAQRLRASLRASDRLARWGGEEFLFALIEVDAPTLLTKAQELCTALGATPLLESPLLTVTGSFGIAHCGENQALDHIIDLADQALYRAKKSGRNRVCE